jgi:hypothetical protein
MISQLLDPSFMKDRVTDLGRVLKKRSERFPQADADVHAEAEKAGVSAADMTAAGELISDLAKNAQFVRKEDEATLRAQCLPCRRRCPGAPRRVRRSAAGAKGSLRGT